MNFQDIQPVACESSWPVLICLLGNFRLLKGGRPIELRKPGKAQSLLFNLALGPGYAVSREALLEALWPNTDSALASQSLSSLIYTLHKLLGDQIGGAAPVVAGDGYYRLNVEAGIGLDIAWFNALVRAGEQHEHMGEHAASLAAFTCALDLYHGDLCVGTDSQAIIEREHLRVLHLSLLARLADDAYRQGDYAACMNYAMRLLNADPCREDAHRLVMKCHVRQGERAQALRQYRLCEAILRAEFDAEPEAATTALYHQVRLDPGSV
jgi:DNA-binding SARP family transcriptional activator